MKKNIQQGIGGQTEGLQKDRHRSTSGAKEGFSSIGRFSKKTNQFGIFWPFYILNKILGPNTLFCVQKSLNRLNIGQLIPRLMQKRIRKV